METAHLDKFMCFLAVERCRILPVYSELDSLILTVTELVLSGIFTTDCEKGVSIWVLNWPGLQKCLELNCLLWKYFGIFWGPIHLSVCLHAAILMNAAPTRNPFLKAKNLLYDSFGFGSRTHTKLDKPSSRLFKTRSDRHYPFWERPSLLLQTYNCKFRDSLQICVVK